MPSRTLKYYKHKGGRVDKGGRRMTKQQRITAFLKNYLQCLNIAQASRMTGISVTQGRTYMKSEIVNEVLQNLHSDPEVKQSIADLQEVKEYLTSCMRGEVTEQVINSKNGTIHDLVPNNISRNRSTELLMRANGWYNMNVNVNESVEITVNFDDDYTHPEFEEVEEIEVDINE